MVIIIWWDWHITKLNQVSEIFYRNNHEAHSTFVFWKVYLFLRNPYFTQIKV